MSLTLRDAQHLSWKTFKKFEAMNEQRSVGLGSVADFVKKAREIAEKIDSVGKSGSGQGKEEFGKKVSELLFIMLVLAERHGVSLEDSFLQTVDELILGFVS